jgi:GTP:adenosylcobinamide-phosphate guanylyltransferase
MAGQGARFGYRFKPFLAVQGKTFIEAAFAPFRPWLAQIDKVYFVITAEQNAAHDVRARLAEMFAGVPHETVMLDKATDGPAQTLRHCLEVKAIMGPVMVCDCDHAVAVDALMRAATDGQIACAVPTWDLKGEPLTAWSVAAVAENGQITAVAEKALPSRGENFRGIIGCYYFSDGARVLRDIAEGGLIHISDVMALYLETGLPVFSVPVASAHFFGDPARLARVAALGT